MLTPMTPTYALRRIAPAAALALVAATLLSGPAAANDRDLLSASSGRPYVFVLLDTSGSMNWSPKCTAAQVAANICTYPCATGDCPVPRDGDDPASKFRQAKEALAEVIGGVTNIDFGFASYNQDTFAVTRKHWLYRVQAGQTVHSLLGGQTWPQVGHDEVFGPSVTCAWGTGDANVGCFWTNPPNAGSGGNPADIDVAGPAGDIPYWERTRAERIAKLGALGTGTTVVYLRTQNNDNQRYRVRYSPNGVVTYGDPTITINVEVSRCTNTNCSNVAGTATLPIVYDKVGDFVMWDFQVQRGMDQGGFFGAQDSTVGNTCGGWDTNADTSADRYPNNAGYSLRFPTIPDPHNRVPVLTPPVLDYGDRIPLDWKQDNKSLLLSRLRPDVGAVEPFANANYLNDLPIGAQTYLRLKDEGTRPLFPAGSTPLGFSLGNFRDWYCEENNPSRSCRNGGGWLSVAQAQDPNWGCRQKYILVVTDGDDTCPGRDPCSYTASLRAQTGILTYVVAFGVENTSGNKLNCMAANGGTGDPIYPQNKQELIDTLNDLFARILERTSTFASAAVPSVQATVADKIFLSNFTPVSGAAIWSGRLDAFLRPLPIGSDGRPDRTRVCGGAVQGECFLWDAGDQQSTPPGYAPRGLLLQAPNAVEVAADSLMLGNGDNERRLLYHVDGPPGNRRLFDYNYPAVPPNFFRNDLITAMGVPVVWGDAASVANAALEVRDTIRFTLREKNDSITNPNTGTTYAIAYLMGDIFHSDPVVVDQPKAFKLYAENVYGDPSLCTPGSAADPPRDHSASYRAFADTNTCRRKLLFVGANDGQLHVFDSGIFRGTDCRLNDGSSVTFPTELGTRAEIDGTFDNGTGRELFAFMPRAVLPTVYASKTATRWAWSVDGTVRVSDAFIDPVNSGTATCLEREWRTLAVGGLREGGRSYYALDITQPDRIDPVSLVPQPSGTYVPSCMDPDPANCGTLPFPSVLWEFTDDPLDSAAAGVVAHGRPMDEDGVGGADLGNTWSVPTLGRIRVCLSDCGTPNQENEDRWVAIFGGGLDNTASATTGNWLYIVDVETGKTIYKRAVIGAVPSTIAAVDRDLNAYLDTAYFGTTAGYLYKVDLGTPTAPLEFQTVVIRDYAVDPDGPGPLTFTSRTVSRIMEPRTRPFRVFSTGGRPIYLQPVVYFSAQRGANGIGFGTGLRWDLWDQSGETGRFYNMLDTGWVNTNPLVDDLADAVCPACPTPLVENQYQMIDPEAVYDPSTPAYLLDILDPTPGWYLPLLPNEKLITEPTTLVGITSFTSYIPRTVYNADNSCSSTGDSRIFVVDTRNANPYVFPDPADPTDRIRYWMVGDFTTQPFREQSATKNPLTASPCTPGTPGCPAPPTPVCETAAMKVIEEELKRLFPSYCKFANYTMDIKTIRSDTGLVCIAPVPICIAPRNWIEFREIEDPPAASRSLDP